MFWLVQPAETVDTNTAAATMLIALWLRVKELLMPTYLP